MTDKQISRFKRRNVFLMSPKIILLLNIRWWIVRSAGY